jgi:bisphosphoglycerate-dependent phosphoglycerate mutase
VPTLNQATGTFKSNFTANLEKKDLFSIYAHLNAIRTILKDINEIVDSKFSNFIISVFPSILYQLFFRLCVEN